MDQNSGTNECARKCWQMSGIAGAMIFLLLWLFTDLEFFSALIAGLLIAVVAGAVLSRIKCSPDSDADTMKSAVMSQPAASTEPEPAKPAAVAASTAQTAVKAETATGDAAVKAPAKKAPVKKAAPKKAAAKTATKTAPAKSPATKPATKPAAKKAPARTPVAADGKPEMLKAARAGGADDLKLLKGVGPKLEQTLNSLGVFHFDQIAAWRKKEILWVDDNLKFKGRIERDEWTKQAKVLAKGDETEFSKRAKKS